MFSAITTKIELDQISILGRKTQGGGDSPLGNGLVASNVSPLAGLATLSRLRVALAWRSASRPSHVAARIQNARHRKLLEKTEPRDAKRRRNKAVEMAR
jgi:hypothetical protein